MTHPGLVAVIACTSSPAHPRCAGFPSSLLLVLQKPHDDCGLTRRHLRTPPHRAAFGQRGRLCSRNGCVGPHPGWLRDDFSTFSPLFPTLSSTVCATIPGDIPGRQFCATVLCDCSVRRFSGDVYRHSDSATCGDMTDGILRHFVATAAPFTTWLTTLSGLPRRLTRLAPTHPGRDLVASLVFFRGALLTARVSSSVPHGLIRKIRGQH